MNTIDSRSLVAVLNSKLGELGQLGEVKNNGVFGVTDKGLTFTSTDGTGKASTITLPLPELPAPAGKSLSGATLAAALDKLQTGLGDKDIDKATADSLRTIMNKASQLLRTQSSGVGGPSSATSGGNVFFDIYALIQLLAECSRTLKAAGKEARNAATAAQINAIHSQAAMQRTAAITGIACAIAVAVVQVGFQTLALAKQNSAISGQKEVNDAHGVYSGERMLENSRCQGNLEVAEASRKEISNNSGLPADEVGRIRTAMQTPKDGTLAKQFEGCGKANVELENGVQNSAGSQVKENLAKAQAAYNADLDRRIAPYEEGVAKARVKYNAVASDPKSTPEQVASARKELVTANKKLEVANACRTEEMSRTIGGQPVSNPEIGAARGRQLEARVAESRANAASDPRNIDLRMKENRWRYIGDALGTAGQALGAVSQNVSKILDSEATEKGVEGKNADLAKDNANDIVESAKDFQSKTIQLLQEVQQAELRSQQEIMRA